MKKNMGIVDRLIRLFIAVVVVVLFVLNIISGTFAIILLVLAGVFILTVLMGFCPLYLPLGIKTIKKNR